MGDKQKPTEKKRGKRKLELNKETIQELSDQDLDQVAGGVGTQAVNCQRQAAVNSAGETCTCSAPGATCA